MAAGFAKVVAAAGRGNRRRIVCPRAAAPALVADASMELPDLAPFRKRLDELTLQSQSPDFFADRRRATDALRDLQRLRSLVDRHEALERVRREVEEAARLATDPAAEDDLRALAREEQQAAAARAAELEQEVLAAMIPPEPNEGRNLLLEIRAGTGGDEASLFAAELLRLYTRFAEDKGWRIQPVSTSPSEAGGIREAVVSVAGDGAWSRLKHESGVHRVQRVPVTEANGRIHTSTVTVAVLPEAEEVDVQIDPADLEISVMRASGPGGQGVNTTDSAVRIVHRPSGLVVFCADDRSQLKNKARALAVLRSRLLKQRQDEEAARTAAERRDQIGGGERSDKIRTYNFPQNRLTDHRIGLTLHDLPAVMEGRIGPVVEALRQAELEARVRAIAAGRI